eukprot:jgi/Botrbrau1/13806/Bobra.0056s0054.1
MADLLTLHQFLREATRDVEPVPRHLAPSFPINQGLVFLGDFDAVRFNDENNPISIQKVPGTFHWAGFQTQAYPGQIFTAAQWLRWHKWSEEQGGVTWSFPF